MRRLLVLLVLLALIAAPVQATAGDAVVTWQAKYVLPDGTGGNTAPVRGYVMWRSLNVFTGFGPWHYEHFDALGIAHITLPLPVVCWEGTNICGTLDGQWLYWTIVPWAVDTCLPLEPPDADGMYSGVDWINGNDMRVGVIYQGECRP